jgi:ATP-binding cassette, subfamily C, bacterial RsaD
VPVFIIVAFLLHPFFGVLAILAALLIFGLAIANDTVTREPIKRATVASIAAQNDASATLRNSEVMRAMACGAGCRSAGCCAATS